MPDSNQRMYDLRKQAFDLLNYLLAQRTLSADSSTKWVGLILQASSEADLNSMIGTLNAIAASDTNPQFID
jgi:hypothetical protein